jgi:hypothetical protein
MKDKTQNTSALSIFVPATATSANGDASSSKAKVTSAVTITIDLAGLISRGKALLNDMSLDTSSGKLSSFRALGKTLLKDAPELAAQFEKTTGLSGFYRIGDPEYNQKKSHEYAIDAVKRGIDFLEMLSG